MTSLDSIQKLLSLFDVIKQTKPWSLCYLQKLPRYKSQVNVMNAHCSVVEKKHDCYDAQSCHNSIR